MTHKRIFTTAFGLRPGDEVAVLPRSGAPPEQVRQLATVAFIGPALIELNNGRLYFAKDGQGLADVTCIARATEEHRAALPS